MSSNSWRCFKCTYDNLPQDQYCLLCHTNRWESASLQEKRMTEGPVELKRRPVASSTWLRLRQNRWEMYWSCPVCKLDNNECTSLCDACGFKATNITTGSISSSSQQSTTSTTGTTTTTGTGGTTTGTTGTTTGTTGTTGTTTTIAGQLVDLIKKIIPSNENKEKTDDDTVHIDDTWTCSKCTFINHPDMIFCEECHNTRITPSSVDYDMMSLDDHVIIPLDDDLIPTDISGHTTTNVSSNVFQWRCPACTFVNPPSNTTCVACDKPHQITSYQRQRSKTESVNETRERQDDQAMAVWLKIVDQYKKLKETFIDPDFPHSNSSLYINPYKPKSKWQMQISGWGRPSQARGSWLDRGNGNWCIYSNPKPSDIAQGALGNCWFLSGLAVVAEIPDLLQQLVITKELCPQGVYLVRLCHDGLWKTVLIDDFFPVYYKSELVFSKAKRKQLWVPLIEKAFAKLCGSYEALDGGHITEGLSVLTGYPCEKIKLKSSHRDIEQELIWGQLLSFKESKFPMAVSSSPVDGVPEHIQNTNELGIHLFHAYSLLDIQQIGTERLVLLRDPWGHTTYKGIGHQWLESEEGTFWIAGKDLFKHFSEVDVCYYHPGWHSLRVCGKFLTHFPTHLEVMTFQIFDPTEISICLYQPSNRGRNDQNHKEVDLCLLVVRYEGEGDSLEQSNSLSLPVECVLHSKSQITSQINCSSLLNPGRYAVMPLSFRNLYKNGQGLLDTAASHDGHVIPYVLALFAAKVVEWQEQVSTKPGFLAESLFLLARKIGKKDRALNNITSYQVQLEPSCYYYIVENHNSNSHLTIELDVSSCINVLSSRNDFFIRDSIPPNHRQVVMVLSPLIVDNGSIWVQFAMKHILQPLNINGLWGSYHYPELTDSNRELHLSRPMF